MAATFASSTSPVSYAANANTVLIFSSHLTSQMLLCSATAAKRNSDLKTLGERSKCRVVVKVDRSAFWKPFPQHKQSWIKLMS